MKAKDPQKFYIRSMGYKLRYTKTCDTWIHADLMTSAEGQFCGRELVLRTNKDKAWPFFQCFDCGGKTPMWEVDP